MILKKKIIKMFSEKMIKNTGNPPTKAASLLITRVRLCGFGVALSAEAEVG